MNPIHLIQPVKEINHDSDTPDDPGNLSKKDESIRAETEEQPQAHYQADEESKQQSSAKGSTSASDKAA